MLNNILAGPILRSTTRNRICVWLALDSEQDITLEILDLKETPIGRSDPDELKSCSFQLGNGLYVYLLQAYPLDAGQIDKQHHYPTSTLCYYRLLDGQSTPINLQDAGLTYGKNKHPIFHIPEKLTSVLHGSCRKPHGAKGEDCLAAGDSLLETTHNKVGKRPDLLLMTGDQIYADDVEASLLDELRRQAKTLMGCSETLPLTEYENTEQLVISPDTIPLGGRTAELKKHHSGLSSTEADNHLMGFGEFAAMYIYVFGNAKKWKKPTHWTDIETVHIPLSEMVKWQDYLSRWRIKPYADIIKEKKDGLEDNAKIVNEFDASLPKVRRLLANIPTYMIFDDHDVTDDWNITGHWYDQVRSSPLGRRVVSNALAAYWAFQGWGNDPDNFDPDMIGSITRHLNSTEYDPDGAERYDLMTWKHRGWGFSIATDPPIIAMDSRTQRQPDNAYYPPRLMDRYALDWLRVEWSKLKTCKKSCHDSAHTIGKDTCPILIATTPVFGFSPLEHIVRLLLWVVSYVENMSGVKLVEKLFGAEGFLATGIVNILDAEAWTENLDGFTDLLNTVEHKMGIEKCVFLSGDVHYSFSVKASYQSADYNGIQQTLECYQLTSSSLRNEPDDSQKKALDDLERFAAHKTLWQRFKHQFRYLQAIRGWQAEHTLLPSDGLTKRIIEQCNLGQVVFNDKGLPTRHTLWRASDNRVDYQLPPFKPAVEKPVVKM
ncbi:MAG: hypothetical protein M0Q44_02630 [Methylobacter sp.]|jgi:hypothetical protein|nr:hypothetical protein [Methylobacter sp.]